MRRLCTANMPCNTHHQASRQQGGMASGEGPCVIQRQTHNGMVKCLSAHRFEWLLSIEYTLPPAAMTCAMPVPKRLMPMRNCKEKRRQLVPQMSETCSILLAGRS